MSFYTKYRIIIIIATLFFVLSELSVTVLTEAQKEEIERLRVELNDALGTDERRAIGDMGVTVQPEWRQNAALNPHLHSQATASDSIRSGINKALKDDIYLGNVQSIGIGNTQMGEELERKSNLQLAVDATVLDATISSKDKTEGKSAGDLKNNATISEPNIVEASGFIEPDIDIRKLQRLEISKRRTRETLVLELIDEDFSFDLGDDIEEWEHIMHGGEEYFVGRRQIDLLIIRKKMAKYEHGKVLHVGEPISYLETYSYWNTDQQQQEGVILVSSKDKVLWYRADNTTGQIELYWEWVVGNEISGLTYFTVGGNEYLAISSNQSSRTGFYALNIYEFELQGKEFWIAQRLQLHYACGEVTILDTGRDILLAVAQNNTAAVYAFNPHETISGHIRFKSLQQIESDGIGIDSITGFKMGGRSYLALGGAHPQILHYQQGILEPKTILGHNFGHVELFFPVPARTYRDDLILLVQHRVDFGTHSLTVIETLIWDGEAFEASMPVPCHIGQHVSYGASCMLDMHRDEGLKGAALLRRDDEIFIIVPRHQTESGLFRLHIKLLPRNSELLDLQEIFAFLQEWVNEQNALIAKAQHYLAAFDDDHGHTESELLTLDSLSTSELSFGGEIKEIYVNDHKWTEEDSQIELNQIMAAIEQLENEVIGGDGMARRTRAIDSPNLEIGTLYMQNIEVDQLWLTNLNGERFFIQNGDLIFDGIVQLRDLTVHEKVLEQQYREAEDDVLEINGDLNFEEINGIRWQDFKEALVFRNAPINLSQLEVDGELIAEEQLSVRVLNRLSFPEDYLRSNGPSSSVVNAMKTFRGTLAANAVDTAGVINGVNPLDAITLSDPQVWTGSPTFKQLEVTEKLELNGSMFADNIEEIPLNPTLLESNILMADCMFQDLEVVGTTHLMGLMDEVDLVPLLGDILQLPDYPDTEILVPSPKSFASVVFPVNINVLDGKLSGTPIEHFVTLNTKQELNITLIPGNVYFSNITVGDTYDGVRASELLEKSIKIDEDAILPNTQFNFVHSVQAESFRVKETLNQIPLVEGFQKVDEDLVVESAEIDYLVADIAEVASDIDGSAQVNGLNLSDFMAKRSWHKDPKRAGNIFLNELTLNNDLEADKWHGIMADLVLEFLHEMDQLPEMILDGKIQVDNVIISGDVQLSQLNGQDFDKDVREKAIWLNRPNYLNAELQFEQVVNVHGDLAVVGNFNGDNLPDLIDDMVFHSANETHEIHGPKYFVKDVFVVTNTQVDAINGIPFSQIANKHQRNSFSGDLEVHGNLIVPELDIMGNINNYHLPSLHALVRYDSDLQDFVLRGEVPFPQHMQLEDLTVFGSLAGLPKLSEFFGNLVFRNRPSVLTGNNTFTGRVIIEEGAYVHVLNGRDLADLFTNIVYIHEPLPVVITTPVTFQQHVEAQELISKEYLMTDNLSGCILNEWLNNTLRVNSNATVHRFLHFAPGTLDGNNLFASYLNEIDASHIVTLHTEQDLDSELKFSRVYLDGAIMTKGLVNEVDLMQEYKNTLLVNGNQHVTTPLTAQSFLVLGDLQTHSAVNKDKDLSQVVTLHGHQEIESPLYFQQLAASQVLTNDTISGINLTKWYNEALWSSMKKEQRITGSWTVQNLTVRTQSSSQPSYELDSDKYLRSIRSDSDYKELCKKVKIAYKKLRERSYFIKHLEIRQRMELQQPDTIERAFAVENFLLLNHGCTTHIFSWQRELGTYSEINSVEAGLLTDALVQGTNQLITISETLDHRRCSVAGLMLWQMRNSSFDLVHRFGENFTSFLLTNEKQPSKLYAIQGSHLKELSLLSPHFKQTSSIELPNTNHTAGSYKFIPHRGAFRGNSDYFLMANNDQIILVPRNVTTLRDKRSQPIQYALPLERDHGKMPLTFASMLASSALMPSTDLNAKSAQGNRNLTFNDFRNLVQRIIVDLVYRLNLEVNITQLSIPETDLFDEHLVEDFLAIMEELQRQQIYPPEMFANLKLTEIQLPSSPAQILAIRTVQIIWPVIVELEEVHSYVRHNGSTEHPICACITTSLGTMVSDVLLLANDKDGSDTFNSNTNKLMVIIERIRQFQSQLGDYAEVLEKEVHGSNVSEAPQLRMPLGVEQVQFTSPQQIELITFDVGPAQQHRQMLAIIQSPTTDPTLPNYITIYANPANPKLRQSISAEQPRHLTVLRIRDDTLLAFIEGCCDVRVLSYRGVQGFVEFTTFRSPFAIQKLFSVNLPMLAGDRNLYLVTVLEHSIKFYELLVVGLKEKPEVNLSCD